MARHHIGPPMVQPDHHAGASPAVNAAKAAPFRAPTYRILPS